MTQGNFPKGVYWSDETLRNERILKTQQPPNKVWNHLTASWEDPVTIPVDLHELADKCARAEMILQTKPRSMNFVVIHRKNLATGEDTTTPVRYDHFVETFHPDPFYSMPPTTLAAHINADSHMLERAIIAKDGNKVKEQLARLMFHIEVVKKRHNLSDQEILQYNADDRSAEFLALRYPESSPVNRLDKALEEQEKQDDSAN